MSSSALNDCLLNDFLAHISGFSGSAGTAIVTLDKAALSTDGRYFNQASKQLDGNWHLLKQGIEEVPTWQEWWVSNFDLCSQACY